MYENEKKDKNQKSNFIYRNSLIIVFSFFTILFLFGQFYTGRREYNEFLATYHSAPVSNSQYFLTGHFIQSTFENWESEFFQMGLFVVFTIFLRQQGSSESKEIGKEHESDKEPVKHKGAPWPVFKGGFILSIYKNSLSIALFGLFSLSFIAHLYGSLKDQNVKNILEHKPIETCTEYLTGSRFWFESFQNWQSEFLSVMVLFFLTIYLRQKGSPQSKAVDSPHEAHE